MNDLLRAQSAVAGWTAAMPEPPRKRRPRWSPDFAIPTSVPLPGCRVRVELRDARGETPDGVWLYDVESDRAAILLDASLPLPVQRYALLHELIHALNDVLDQMIEKYPDLVQTRHMAGIPYQSQIVV
ncbi:MAG: hypothetical protein ACREF4_14540 [Gammaproteobacteria bacterium]